MARVTKLNSIQSRNPATVMSPPIVPLNLATYDLALKSVQNEPFLHTIKFKEQQLRAIREGAHPDILDFEEALIKRMAKHMVPMWPHSIVRGERQQQQAFDGGFSKAQFGKSPHNFGCAVDIVHGVLAWGLDKKAWEIVGHIGKEVAQSKGIHIVWGGDFKSLWDPAHWELRDWKDLKDQYPWQPKTTVKTRRTLVDLLKDNLPTCL